MNMVVFGAVDLQKFKVHFEFLEVLKGSLNPAPFLKK